MNATFPAVLLVEDDAATAELERRALIRAGRTVRTTDRVEHAVAILREDRIQAVVLDYRLRDGQAWPVLEAAQAVVPRVPVLVVTAMGDERVAAEAVHRGAVDYLIKSGDFAERLTGAVDRAIRLAEAERANARLASIVEFSEDAIIGATPDGTVLSWNQGAERLFGRSAGEAAGLNLLQFVAEDRVPEVEEIRARAVRGDRGGTFETVGRRSDGSRIDLSITLSAVKDAEGRTTGLSVVARDMTEFKQMQEDVVRGRSLAAVGEMTASIAHEIKNPLAAIGGPLQILIDEAPAADPRREILAEILGQVNRLDKTVRELLMLSKPWTPKKEPIVLREYAERIAGFLKESGQDRGVRFAFEGGEGLRVAVDPALFEQVYWNLILNAAQAMKGMGEIRVSIGAAERHVEVAIADTGGGIPAQLMPRLFQPFVTSKAGGTGLGLSVCRKIVEAHGGTIEIASEPGRGTTVRLRFPLVSLTIRR